jgi:hypothetical protein
MKKFVLALIVLVSTPTLSLAQSLTYEWLNVKTNLLNDGSSQIESIDMKNISRDTNQMRYFWKKSYWNFIGSNLSNTTIFTYTKVDCQKKMWTSTALQRFKDNTLIESKDSTNHSFPWNFFDFSDERDRRTYSIVCG